MASKGDNCPNSLPDNDSSVKSPQNAGVQHDGLGLISSDSGPEVLAATYQDTLSQAAPSIEIDKMTLPDPDEDGTYCDILWNFFYRPGKIGTKARIINKDFALVLAEVLSLCYQTTPAKFAQYLQSGDELGRLRRMFYKWLNETRMDGDSDLYKAVEKCEGETRTWGKMILKEYESCMHVDKRIAPLRTDLFLDLSVGKKLDLVDGVGTISQYYLEQWVRVNEQEADLNLAHLEGARQECFRVNVTGEIISNLRSQGIFF